ncbi:hypothetical protein BT63DRAFT_452411 [Microthyrium microscopicum]|uniref:Uncharacterized protein n=1 Tax=Microthyrium microscopicum TaxID=703497 RepID=A0A6A6ULE6_9PEZI|nr:hypothetical protein BT63DRAFT_452411 [Microthyrium microscopicum]
MQLPSTLLIALSAIQVAQAWTFTTNKDSYKSTSDMPCQTVSRSRNDHYTWDGKDSTRDGVSLNCCALLYSDKTCKGSGYANERHCGQYSGTAKEDFRSFAVFCAKSSN